MRVCRVWGSIVVIGVGEQYRVGRGTPQMRGCKASFRRINECGNREPPEAWGQASERATLEPQLSPTKSSTISNPPSNIGVRLERVGLGQAPGFWALGTADG